MPISEQLYLRALRMLNDGLEHSAAALAWARSVCGFGVDELEIPDQRPDGFTLRELSLGAAEVVSL
jgi:hypothetical protein